MYLVGNKVDKEREVQKEVVEEFICQNKYKYFETSAKDNRGIDVLFQELSEDLYQILVEAGGKNRTYRNKKLKIYKGNKSIKDDCFCTIK